ncbi:hypothetical protein ACQUFE_18035, partial [Enterococcus casseliflavus]|uniref:hypothetical protein n=1 Tax=Enterococcus casseliflavus TaxID=37734 RepID=UPI003D108C87
VGSEAGSGIITVPTNDVRELRLLVSLPKDKLAVLESNSVPFKLSLIDAATGARSSHTARFQSAQRRESDDHDAHRRSPEDHGHDGSD